MTKVVVVAIATPFIAAPAALGLLLILAWPAALLAVALVGLFGSQHGAAAHLR